MKNCVRIWPLHLCGWGCRWILPRGLPHLEVNGFRECSVDRHTGILEYNRERIVIGLNIGSLTVVGSGLEIRADAPGTADDHRAD